MARTMMGWMLLRSQNWVVVGEVPSKNAVDGRPWPLERFNGALRNESSWIGSRVSVSWLPQA